MFRYLKNILISEMVEKDNKYGGCVTKVIAVTECIHQLQEVVADFHCHPSDS